tara:strand:+ start:1767 stop:1997 length:231 start_codon:yes stop_codon:yes gene_type:complete
MEADLITDEGKMKKYVNKNSYLVVFPDLSIKLFRSLREIQSDISIDSSTISKKLANNEHYFTAKMTKYVFYINKIN